MFYEDEVEITGIPYESAPAKSKLALAAASQQVSVGNQQKAGQQQNNGQGRLSGKNELLIAEKQLVEYVQRQCLGMTETPCHLLAAFSGTCASSLCSPECSQPQGLDPRELSPPLSALAMRLLHQTGSTGQQQPVSTTCNSDNSSSSSNSFAVTSSGGDSSAAIYGVSALQSPQLMADGCQVAALALEAALVGNMGALIQPTSQWAGRHSFDEATRAGLLHRWAFLQVATPPNHATVVKLLRSLQPILQDGVHNQRKVSALFPI